MKPENLGKQAYSTFNARSDRIARLRRHKANADIVVLERLLQDIHGII